MNFLKSQLGLKVPGLGNFPISNTLQISNFALKDAEVNSMVRGSSRDHPGKKSKSDRLLNICNLNQRPGFVQVVVRFGVVFASSPCEQKRQCGLFCLFPLL